IPSGDVFTVFLGTNDWWHGNHLGTWGDYANNTGDTTIYGCFRIILDKLHALNPQAPIILMTPMPRADFVYINNPKNNAWGSYKPKDGQTLGQVADAVITIGRREHHKVVDLYHDNTTIPFDPAQEEYAYPEDAANMTFDGLHPSNQGAAEIAKDLVKVLKKI